LPQNLQFLIRAGHDATHNLPLRAGSRPRC
jgi:hypothetical protein